jgi:hypothetical protein
MGKTALTDRKVLSLKAAPKDTRYQVMDSVVAGFGVRVTDKGIRHTSCKPASRGIRVRPAVRSVALAS